MLYLQIRHSILTESRIYIEYKTKNMILSSASNGLGKAMQCVLCKNESQEANVLRWGSRWKPSWRCSMASHKWLHEWVHQIRCFILHTPENMSPSYCNQSCQRKKVGLIFCHISNFELIFIWRAPKKRFSKLVYASAGFMYVE